MKRWKWRTPQHGGLPVWVEIFTSKQVISQFQLALAMKWLSMCFDLSQWRSTLGFHTKIQEHRQAMQARAISCLFTV